MRKNVAIFGCGTGGRRAWAHLRSNYRIVAFLDNDASREGSKLLGVPVFHPESYDYGQVEHVFIASMYFDEMFTQLLALDLSSKIEFIGDDILMRDRLSSRAETIGLLAPLNFVLRAFYLPFRLLRWLA